MQKTCAWFTRWNPVCNMLLYVVPSSTHRWTWGLLWSRPPPRAQGCSYFSKYFFPPDEGMWYVAGGVSSVNGAGCWEHNVWTLTLFRFWYALFKFQSRVIYNCFVCGFHVTVNVRKPMDIWLQSAFTRRWNCLDFVQRYTFSSTSLWCWAWGMFRFQLWVAWTWCTGMYCLFLLGICGGWKPLICFPFPACVPVLRFLVLERWRLHRTYLSFGTYLPSTHMCSAVYREGTHVVQFTFPTFPARCPTAMNRPKLSFPAGPVSEDLVLVHHTSSYIIMHHHTSSYIIIHHHTSSYIIIHHHTSSYIISVPYIIINPSL